MQRVRFVLCQSDDTTIPTGNSPLPHRQTRPDRCPGAHWICRAYRRRRSPRGLPFVCGCWAEWWIGVATQATR